MAEPTHLALLTLITLAITSTNIHVRQLGFKRWKLLHRLANAAGILGVIHFYLRVKVDVREPLTIVAIFAAGFVLRFMVGFEWVPGSSGRQDKLLNK